jgi:serine/threonine protein kinase
MKRVVLSNLRGTASIARYGEAPDLLPGARVGGVVIEAKLGTGWEGSVYRVRGLGTRQRRVLKCYRRRPGLKPAIASRVKYLRKLRGCTAVPNLESQVRLIQGRREWPALLLQYAPGVCLSELHARRPSGRLPLAEARPIMLAILRALDRLHTRGSYHGDLHEGNVLIAPCGRGIRAHLVDPYPQAGAVCSLQAADLVESVRVFGRLLGGGASYSSHPRWIREVLRGSQARRILDRFASVTDLLQFVQKGAAAVRRSSA